MGPTVATVLTHGSSAAAHPLAGGPTGPGGSWAALAVVIVVLVMLLWTVRRPDRARAVWQGILSRARRASQGAAAAGTPLRAVGQAPALRVEGRLALGPGRQLLVVRAGGRRVLVGVGPDVHLLAEWPPGADGPRPVPEALRPVLEGPLRAEPAPASAPGAGGPAEAAEAQAVSGGATPFSEVLEAHLGRIRRAGRLPLGGRVRGRRG